MNTTNLIILSLTLLTNAGQRLAKIEYVAPFAGRIFVDGKCMGEPYFHSGWANKPTAAGTNSITFSAANCPAGAFYRLRLTP